MCVGTALNIPRSQFALEQMAKFHHHLCISPLCFPWTSQAFCLLAKGPAPSLKHPMQQKAPPETQLSLGRLKTSTQKEACTLLNSQ